MTEKRIQNFFPAGSRSHRAEDRGGSRGQDAAAERSDVVTGGVHLHVPADRGGRVRCAGE